MNQETLIDALWSISLDAGCDEETGTVDGFGLWAGLLHGKHQSFLVTQDSYGFKDADYGTREEMQARFDAIEERFQSWIEVTEEM